MKLVEKLKEIPKIALLSAAVLSASVGCATPWETVGTEYRPTGIEREVVTGTTIEKEKELLAFEISEPYIEGKEYEVQITESLEEVNSQINTIGTEEEFRKFLILKRETGPNRLKVLPYMSGIIGGGGMIAGMIFGTEFAEPAGPILLGGLAGGLAGAATGALLTLCFPKSTTQTGKRRTNETIQRLSDSRTTERIPGENLVVYQNEPASGISVKLSGEGKDKMYLTDNEGELNVSQFVDLLNPQYFFRNYTDRELEKRFANIPLVQQIKPKTLESLMEDFMQVVSPKEVRLTASTEEESSAEFGVENDSKTFNVKGVELTDEVIYDVVRQFVNEEINSQIKSLTFIVRDNVTRVPINGSNFEFELYAPRKEDLAGQYFTQDLRDYAQRCIRNYLEESIMIGDLPSKVFFDIYSPAMVRVEITNPDYHFVSGTILMEDENLEKEVYMVDKGSKIRVQDADNERGRIE